MEVMLVQLIYISFITFRKIIYVIIRQIDETMLKIIMPLLLLLFHSCWPKHGSNANAKRKMMRRTKWIEDDSAKSNQLRRKVRTAPPATIHSRSTRARSAGMEVNPVEEAVFLVSIIRVIVRISSNAINSNIIALAAVAAQSFNSSGHCNAIWRLAAVSHDASSRQEHNSSNSNPNLRT